MANNPDTDNDGFMDKMEIDWGCDPLSAVSTPLWIIALLVGLCAVVIVIAAKVGLKRIALKKKKLAYGASVDNWLDGEIAHGTKAIEEKIDEKRAILSRVMEPMTPEEVRATIAPESPGKLSAPGKKKEKGSGQEETVKHEVDEKTESEVDVIKKKEFCIVCNTNLKATTFICPYCETKYCIRCAIALSEQHEACWVCKNPLNFSP